MVRLRSLGIALLTTGAAVAGTTFVSGAAEPTSTSPPATMSISPSLASVAGNSVPLINQPLVPDAVKPGGAGFTLTVTGTGFVSGATVHWNGAGRTTTFLSSSRLTASILAADIAKTGTASITVVNPSPGGGTSNPVFFEVTIPSPSMAFGAPTNFSIPSEPDLGAVGDFNGDGKLDLAVADEFTGVSVLLGNGDGTFRPQVTYPTGRTPLGIAVGDFNRDGKLDLAVTNESDGTVSILLGNGDGTFRAAGSYATGGNSPYFVAVGDFNSDGKLDLVATNRYSNTISVFLGNGDGTFQPAVNYAAGTQPLSIAVGDFNGDGKLDLAVANFGSDNVSVFLGNGDGTFRAAIDYATGSGSWPQSLAAADFNGDGKLDLAVATYYTGTIVLLGKGDGSFQTAGNLPVGGAWLAAADFNGDGKSDLLVVNGDAVSILLGNGDGTFQPHLDYAVTQPTSAMVGDFNGDGRLDVAVTSIQSVVQVLLQGAIASLSKTSLTYANQLIGATSAAQIVILTNVSGFTVALDSVAVTGANAGDFKQTNGCGSALSPGGSCTITVTFTPTHTGLRSAFITITDNGKGSPQQIALGGAGVVSGPNATLAPASITYLTQLLGTASATQSVTLSNYGMVALKVSGVAASGDFSAASACGSSVPAGASCTITVTFKPTQIGTRTGSLSVTDNAPGSPHIVSLSGTGTVVNLNPRILSFHVRSLYACSTETTALTNTGNSTITITGISTGRPFTQSNTCGSSVSAGKSCNIAVTFCSSSYRQQTGAVSVSDNGGGSPQQVILSGATQCCR